jgi:hypothetical protein
MITCPMCLSPTSHRSRVRLYELPLLLFFFRPYRCMSCYRRFYKFSGLGASQNNTAQTTKEP